MIEDGKDLKELKKPKGPIQKFADAENRIPDNDRKAQMIGGLEASRNIPNELRKHDNTKSEKPKDTVKNTENSSILTQEIKRQVEGMER